MARIKAKPMNKTSNNYNTPKFGATNGYRQPTQMVTSPGQTALPAQLTPVSPPANMSANSSLLSAHSSPGVALGGDILVEIERDTMEKAAEAAVLSKKEVTKKSNEAANNIVPILIKQNNWWATQKSKKKNKVRTAFRSFTHLS